MKWHSGMKYCRQPVKANVQGTLEPYYTLVLNFAFLLIFDCQSPRRRRCLNLIFDNSLIRSDYLFSRFRMTFGELEFKTRA